MNEIISYKIGDVIHLKKNHACGNNAFKIFRIGMEIGLVCESCRQTILLPRKKFERLFRK